MLIFLTYARTYARFSSPLILAFMLVFFGYARRLMYARALGFIEMLDVCLMYFCVVVIGYAVDNCCSKKNLNASRPSEHLPVGEKCQNV